jgi:hypothetical protein
MQLRAKDVQILRGICRQIDWYGRHCFAQGLRAGAAQKENSRRPDARDD